MVYAGTFLIAFAVLALEITLTRLLSVVAWYHLAFFVIATAMLGMTAGAIAVYLRPRRFAPDRLAEAVGGTCLRFALAVPVTLIALCMLPLVIDKSLMCLFVLLAATAACSLPYYFAGMAVSAVLTKSKLPIGRLYASDLIGASAGCLFVLGGLEVLDAPSLILLCGAVGALAAAAFAWRAPSARPRTVALAAFLLLGVLAAGNAASSRFIRPLCVKGRVLPAAFYKMERWNSFSRVAVFPLAKRVPQLWGPSPKAPTDAVEQYAMHIDGEAGTCVTRFQTPSDIEYLRYDVTNVAYALRPRGGACIIGVGGGRDVQSALLFGHERVTGVEINPIFIDLLRNEFRGFAGIADRKEVTLVVDEARSYLSRATERFAVIQMSLVDTWAATGTGAFSLSENSLYTLEAWDAFLARLEDDGVFTVSRWYSPGNLGETARLVSMGIAAALRAGALDPSRHVALVTSGRVSTLILGKRPLGDGDIARLRQVCAEMGFNAAAVPSEPPEHPLLREIVSARSLPELLAAADRAPLRCDPTTDENPYFFNMLRLGHTRRQLAEEAGVVMGNLWATLALLALILCLVLMAVATILVPLALRRRLGDAEVRSGPVAWPGALYFSLIGAGFMLVEIAMIQRLTVLLSHPVYALGVLLFTIILSTGIGSLLSERLPLTRAPWMFVYPLVAAAAILAAPSALRLALSQMMAAPMMSRILVAVALTFPIGVILGLFFPTGMRLASQVSAGETPWYWALNGVFGVLCSALAVFISIYTGISTNFYIAAACYAAVAACVWGLHRRIAAHAQAP